MIILEGRNMIWLFVSVIICIIFSVRESKSECNTISIETQIISTTKISKPYRFVFLSDLHDKEFGEGNSKLIRAVKAVHPNAILIGGDIP